MCIYDHKIDQEVDVIHSAKKPSCSYVPLELVLIGRDLKNASSQFVTWLGVYTLDENISRSNVSLSDA